MLNQLHVNIPFMDAIENMPPYAKLFKDFLNKKKKFEDYETVALTE